jgi:hypothetical protein
MDESSSSRTWVSSLRSGHGKHPLHIFNRSTIAYATQVRISTSGKMTA